MNWSSGPLVEAFVDFARAWRRLEPKLVIRIASLDAPVEHDGTVEDLWNLSHGVEWVLHELSRNVLPLPLHVLNACAFVKLWSRADRLGEEIAALVGLYVDGFEHVASAQGELASAFLSGCPGHGSIDGGDR